MRDILTNAEIVMILMWPFSVHAAQAGLTKSFADFSFTDLLIALLISSMSGLTALLSQMKSDYEKEGMIKRLPLYMVSKMFGSNLAGVTMYVYASSHEWEVGTQIISIIIAAFGGTWALQRAVDFFVNRAFPPGPPGPAGTTEPKP